MLVAGIIALLAGIFLWRSIETKLKFEDEKNKLKEEMRRELTNAYISIKDSLDILATKLVNKTTLSNEDLEEIRNTYLEFSNKVKQSS